MDLSIFRGLNEAYSAVYDEDIRNELEEMSDDFAGVEYLSDEELNDIVDETIGEMLDEGYNFGEVEYLLEGVLLELNPYAPAGSQAAKQYQKSASSTKKSAERSAARAATVARVKGAVTGAIERLKGAAKSAVGKAKEAGRSAKFNVVDKPIASYAARRNLLPGPGLAAKSKDPEKRRGLRAKVVSDIASRVKGKIKSAVNAVGQKAAAATGKAKQKAASAAVSGYAAGRVAAQTASDAANRAGQGAKNAANKAREGIKGAVGKTARAVSSRAGNLASRLGEEVDVYDIILSHLLDEGYADTYEAAESIMVNMSEEWREDILDESGLSQDTIQRAVIERQKRNDAELEKDTPEGDAAYKKGAAKVQRSKSHLHINQQHTMVRPSYWLAADTKKLYKSNK